MLPPKVSLPQDQQQLLDSYAKLSQEDKRTLLSFAAFLGSRDPATASQQEQHGEPLRIERPERETVVAAMRRLSATYPMLDKGPMLNQASALMGAHLMQGKPAEEVIDQLEVLFEEHFTVYTRRE